MSCFNLARRSARRGGVVLALVTALTLAPIAAAQAQAPTTHPGEGQPGMARLELADLPEPTVEIDLSHGVIAQALSLGEAVLSGFVNGLQENASSDNAEAVRFVAGQVASTQELTEILREVVQGVHLSVWKDVGDLGEAAAQVPQLVSAQLSKQGWEPTVRAREGDKLVHLYLQREGEAIRGVFVLAKENNEMVMANVTGDLSAENVQRLTSIVTKIAVDTGLDGELRKAVDKIQQKRQR